MTLLNNLLKTKRFILITLDTRSITHMYTCLAVLVAGALLHGEAGVDVLGLPARFLGQHHSRQQGQKQLPPSHLYSKPGSEMIFLCNINIYISPNPILI